VYELAASLEFGVLCESLQPTKPNLIGPSIAGSTVVFYIYFKRRHFNYLKWSSQDGNYELSAIEFSISILTYLAYQQILTEIVEKAHVAPLRKDGGIRWRGRG
jgi:hypothetical protein